MLYYLPGVQQQQWVMICSFDVVKPNSIVTDVLVLNKCQNIGDHRVDYIVSLRLYESYCIILILLGRDSICFRSPAKTSVPCVSWHDVDVSRMVETWLAIAIYASATFVDHPG